MNLVLILPSPDNLMARIGLSEGVGDGEVESAGVRGGGVRVVDLTQARGTVGSLTETKITCTNEEKVGTLRVTL